VGIKFSFIIWILLLGFFDRNLTAQSQWKLHKQNESYTLWIKDVENSKFKQFKIQTYLNEELKSMYNIFKDVEQMHLWYDKVKRVSLLKKISSNEAIYLLEYDLPFPFEDRITTIKGTINYDERIEKITVKTEYIAYPIPDLHQNMPLIKNISGGWEIVKTKKGTLLITHHGYMDPGGNVPIWLVNESLTSGPPKTLEGLKNLVKKYRL